MICEQAFWSCFLLFFFLSPNFVKHARVSVSESTSFVLVCTDIRVNVFLCRGSWSTMGTRSCLHSAKAVVWQLPDLVSASFLPSIGHTDYPCNERNASHLKAKAASLPSTYHRLCTCVLYIPTYTYSPHTAYIQPTYSLHTAYIPPARSTIHNQVLFLATPRLIASQLPPAIGREGICLPP